MIAITTYRAFKCFDPLPLSPPLSLSFKPFLKPRRGCAIRKRILRKSRSGYRMRRREYWIPRPSTTSDMPEITFTGADFRWEKAAIYSRLTEPFSSRGNVGPETHRGRHGIFDERIDSTWTPKSRDRIIALACILRLLLADGQDASVCQKFGIPNLNSSISLRVRARHLSRSSIRSAKFIGILSWKKAQRTANKSSAIN